MKNFIFNTYILIIFGLLISASSFAQVGVVDLNQHSNTNPPANSSFEWHNAFPLTTSSKMTNTQASTAAAGVYYGVFYDTERNCYSPATRLNVVNNKCPLASFDLTTFSATSVPTGTVLEWHNSSSPSTTTKISNPKSVGDGTYWAVFHDTVNGCYSPPTPVIVSTINCITYCLIPANTTGSTKSTNNGISTINNSSSWPQNRNGGALVLESTNKGFVINSFKTVDLIKIVNPVEGMMVFDETVSCIKIYSKNTDNTLSWKCYNIQGCPQ